MDFNSMENHAKNIRENILRMITKAGSGHPGGSLSIVEILTVLYFDKMNIDKKDLKNKDRDRFVLSKGHAAPGLYSVLIEKGIIGKAGFLAFCAQKNPEFALRIFYMLIVPSNQQPVRLPAQWRPGCSAAAGKEQTIWHTDCRQCLQSPGSP